jgi:hypothetical protein
MVKKSWRNSSFTRVQGKADFMEDLGFSARRGKDGCDLVGFELSLTHRFFRCF